MSRSLVLLVLALLPLGASDAWGAGATCGMVVQDTLILDRDLRCAGTALVVRNPRSVVQLNGHVIESARPCTDPEVTIGIAVEATADRAQILGPGVVRGFQTGIAVDAATQVQLRDVRVADSCALGLAVRVAHATRARNLVFDRNGNGGDTSGAIRVDDANRFSLTESDVLLNDAGGSGAAVDLRRCHGCRVAGNRIVANRGAGLRLDGETQANEVERNLVLGQRPHDIVDQGSDNLFVLNAFERGDGVDPPVSWPLLGVPMSPAPGVAGCGTMTSPVGPRATVAVACPQDTGLRAVRNSVVAYRLLNPFNTTQIFGATCTPGSVRPASGSAGGAVTCANPDSLFPAILEVTCCLN